jgi:hypothetical protein
MDETRMGIAGAVCSPFPEFDATSKDSISLFGKERVACNTISSALISGRFSEIDQAVSGIGEVSPSDFRRHSEGEAPVSSLNARLKGPRDAKPMS